MYKITTIFAALFIALFSFSSAAVAEEPKTSDVKEIIDLKLTAELGFLAVADHRFQAGKNNQNFDFIREGGQENLYLFNRLSVDLTLLKQHTLTLLYQPLEIVTKTNFVRAVNIGEATFGASDPVDMRYSFPFYRLTYRYDFFPESNLEVGLGLGFQIRNATIEFTKTDGSERYFSSDVGVVPLIAFRVQYVFDSGFFLGTQLDGFYAPIKYMNVSDTDVVGLIIDGSIFAGFQWDRFDIFLTARYLGGGAEGTSKGDQYNLDGFVNNWLHFITVSLGASVRL